MEKYWKLGEEKGNPRTNDSSSDFMQLALGHWNNGFGKMCKYIWIPWLSGKLRFSIHHSRITSTLILYVCLQCYQYFMNILYCKICTKNVNSRSYWVLKTLNYGAHWENVKGWKILIQLLCLNTYPWSWIIFILYQRRSGVLACGTNQPIRWGPHSTVRRANL